MSSTLPVTLSILLQLLGGAKADWLEPVFELYPKAEQKAFEFDDSNIYPRLTFPEDVVDEVTVGTLIGILLFDGDNGESPTSCWHEM